MTWFRTSPRQTARENGEKQYVTGKPCIRGHVSPRLVSTGTCLECAKSFCAGYRKENFSEIAQYNTANKVKLNEQKIDWAAKNSEKANIAYKKWRKNNPAKLALLVIRRRMAQVNRTPSWLNAGQLFEMESIYNYCAALRSTGLDYHVDHIVPLRGNNVSGLHVPWNLQVITGAENMSKGNRFNG
jgi:5-methylcytosine-specific restriction endonuclease McrA